MGGPQEKLLSGMLIDRLLIQKSQTHTSARCSSGPDVTATKSPKDGALAQVLSNVKARMQLCSAYCVPRAPDGGPPKQHSAILKGQSEEEDSNKAV